MTAEELARREERAQRLFRQSLTFSCIALGLAVGLIWGTIIGVAVALVKFLVF